MSTKKKLLITLIAIGILIIGYFIGAFYYNGKFLNNAYVNDTDLSGMTLEKAKDELSKSNSWNKIVIKSDKEEFLQIKSDEIDYKYIDSPELPEVFKKQNKWKWPLAVFKKSTYTTPVLAEYNDDKIKEKINGIDQLDTEPLNARVVYSENSDAFVIEPHRDAIGMTRDQLFDLVKEGINTRDKEVNVEKNIVKPTIFEDDESLAQARDKANEYLEMKITYDFSDREEVIDRSLLKDFIFVNGTEIDVNADKVKEYVTEMALKYDTFASSREFKTNTGEVITTSGGSYGWLIHRGDTSEELIQHIKEGQDKTIEPVYSYEALIRDTDDLGNSYVEIDLSRQMVFVYIDGELKVQTPTVTGSISRGHATPPGVYPLNYKETNAVLRGETYASPVKYWMPFNGDIGLHDADWRASFGGNIYQNNGSHGCINLPPGNAKTIFDLVYPGMPVVVH